jgi:predicted dinucleotide-binding enzyme
LQARSTASQLDILITADDDDAKQKVSQLVADGGVRSIDVGPLGGAQLEQLDPAHLDPAAAWPRLREHDQAPSVRTFEIRR